MSSNDHSEIQNMSSSMKKTAASTPVQKYIRNKLQNL